MACEEQSLPWLEEGEEGVQDILKSHLNLVSYGTNEHLLDEVGLTTVQHLSRDLPEVNACLYFVKVYSIVQL